MENPIDDLTFIQEIATCQYGKLYLTSKQGSSNQYCTKIINKNQTINNHNFRNELDNNILILKDLNHPNVIKFFEFKETQDKYYIVTEYYNGGNLQEYITKYRQLHHKNLTEEIVQYIMRQIVEGIKYIHNKKIINRGISLDNILINYDNEKDKQNANIMKAQIKICDFNFAAHIPKGKKERKIIGIPLYMDPRVLKQETNYDYKYDIWSLGIICYELLSNETPFSTNDFQELLEKIRTGKYNVPKIWSNEIISFLNCTLQYKEEKRLSSDILYNHEFLRKDIREFTKINLRELKDIEISGSNIVMKIKNNDAQNAYFENEIEY